jgi:hypothetical protein
MAITLQAKESVFLVDLAYSANVSLEFKDESILPGTAWIDGMPIDITIYENHLILNSIGEFGGTEKSFARSKNRGRGAFKNLYQHFPELLKKHGLEARIYLTPLSPVWKKNYPLVESKQPLKGHWYFLDVEHPPVASYGTGD